MQILLLHPYIRYNGGIVRLTSFEAIDRALNDASVRYLIAGGLAVNAPPDFVLALETPPLPTSPFCLPSMSAGSRAGSR